MPSDATPPLDFGIVPMDADTSSRGKSYSRWGRSDRLKAYKPVISPEMLAAYREEYTCKTDDLQHISFAEYATFRDEDRMDVLNDEIINIRSRYFGFPIVQHSDCLVEFYTGLPNATHFYSITSQLQRWIFRSYIRWESDEKHGFLNHTMITLMKLRLNMPDEELAERFGIEPYVVNMTLRTWLPGLYLCIYNRCEDLYKVPRDNDDQSYTKVLDIVEVCFETPEYTRRHRGNKHEVRKAVLSVRNDGFIHYASPVVSVNQPDAETIKRSRFSHGCYIPDMVAVHPEHCQTIHDMGIACRRMDEYAETNIEETVNRLSEFRILMAIPTEYKTFHEYIFPVCAALSNFYLVEDDEQADPGDLLNL